MDTTTERTTTHVCLFTDKIIVSDSNFLGHLTKGSCMSGIVITFASVVVSIVCKLFTIDLLQN